MYLNWIYDFELKFKTFDRLNILLFNVWRDKNASAYRDGDIARITNEYRHYISQVRTLAEQASQLNKKLGHKRQVIDDLTVRVTHLGYNPQINGCSIFKAYGENDTYHEDGSLGPALKTPQVRFVCRTGKERMVAENMIGDCERLYVDTITNL